MKKYINYGLSILAIATLGACSKDEPFGWDDEAPGKVLKSALALEVNNADDLPILYRATRAVAPVVDDFTVDFYKEGESEPTSTYVYKDMPEVVTLPAGAFTAVAHYGENASAAWEAPYFKGETKFVVVSDKVTDDVDPIVAKLSNVRVSIKFDAALKNAISSDAKVSVMVGESGTLDFTAADADRSGYFAYVENSHTLTATFSGKVEGYDVVESKGYDNVAPGQHYSITFRLHDAGAEDPGEVSAGVIVDAEVEIVDMNVTLDPEEDEILKDDLRPVEGEEENPGPVNPPTPDDPDKVAPKAEALVPAGDFAGYDKLNLDAVNEATDHLYCAWKVVSEAEGGFKVFTVDIISNTLTPGELSGVGLTDHIDLINPGEYEEALAGLGFPVNVGGLNSAEFDITSFLSLLGALGEGNHEFRLTVTDANGTSVVSVKLHTN